MAPRKASAALMKEVEVDDALEAIIGCKKASRGQIVKKVWAYIKKHGLQDEENKRMINPDKALSKVVGSKSLDMFKMMKQISKHIKKEPKSIEKEKEPKEKEEETKE